MARRHDADQVDNGGGHRGAGPGAHVEREKNVLI